MVATLLAALLRISLNQADVSEAPYLPFFTAVLISAVWGGRVAGVVSSIGGGILSFSLVSYPYGSIVTHLRGVAIFFVLCGILTMVVDAMRSALQREAQLNQQLTMITREQHHRMRNVITLATSIAQQTGRNALSVADYEAKFTARLAALGRAQDLLIDAGAERVALAALVDKILSPFDMADHLTRPIEGPDVEIEQYLATTLALLLNELATNATKHGALSVSQGRLAFHWAHEGEWTWIDWIESDGPKVMPPARSGFGSRLFQSALPIQMGRIEVEFRPAGLCCRIGLRRNGAKPGASAPVAQAAAA
jgi:two-component sensor histidine kinase